MARAAVITSHRAGVIERDRALEFVLDWWDSWRPEWRVTVGHAVAESGMFWKSRALNAAMAAAVDADEELEAIVVIDADIIPGGTVQLDEALELALSSRRLTFAHTWRHQLTPQGSENLYAGDGELEAFSLDRNTFSSLMILPLELWHLVRGFDERFAGWGWEDLAFMCACRELGGGIERVAGDVYHLWHPPYAGWGNEDDPKLNDALGMRYLETRGRRRMRRLVDGRPS